MGMECRSGLENPDAVAMQTLSALQPRDPFLNCDDSVAGQSLWRRQPPEFAFDSHPFLHQMQSTVEPFARCSGHAVRCDRATQSINYIKKERPRQGSYFIAQAFDLVETTDFKWSENAEPKFLGETAKSYHISGEPSPIPQGNSRSRD